MRILVTGGAGYIGSSCIKALCDKRHIVCVVDNLSKGILDNVDPRAEFFKLDITEAKKLDDLFSNKKFDAIIHFAAYKAVGESMENPIKYSDNIKGTLNILDSMVRHNVKKIVFSSSAAVYDDNNSIVTEKSPLNPKSYYGYTKKAGEELIEWYSKTHGITGISLRYFNVAGDYGLGYIDPEPENVLPIMMEVLTGKRDEFIIYGDDYDTRDGTCIRDYIHIIDLVDAHVLALNLNETMILNLGTGNGTSVLELVQSALKIDSSFKYKIGPRRKGDPGVLVADNSKAKKIMGWSPKHDIDEMLKSTLKAYTKNE